jgi:hypothetical protein
MHGDRSIVNVLVPVIGNSGKIIGSSGKEGLDQNSYNLLARCVASGGAGVVARLISRTTECE